MDKPKITNLKEKREKEVGSGQITGSRDYLKNTNPAQYQYEQLKLAGNPYLNDNKWDFAVAKGESSLLNKYLLDNATKYNPELEYQKAKYGDTLSYDAYMLSLSLPSLDDSTKKDRTFQYADGRIETKGMTDKEYALSALKDEYAKLDATIIEERKKSAGFFKQAWNEISSTGAMAFTAGANAINNLIDVVAGLGNVIGDRFYRIFTDPLSALNPLTDLGSSLKAYLQGEQATEGKVAQFLGAEAAKEYMRTHSLMYNYETGETNTIGTIVGGILDTGAMFIPGTIFGKVGKLAKLGTKSINGIKQTSFYSQMFTQYTKDAVNSAMSNGLTWDDINAGEIMANAAIKTSIQYLLEGALATNVSKLLGQLGKTTGKVAELDAKMLAKGATSSRGTALAISAGRAAYNAVKEGLQEVTQNLSDALIDYTFSAIDSDEKYGFSAAAKENISGESLALAFTIGSLFSGLVSTFSTAKAVISMKVDGTVAVGTDENGQPYELGTFQTIEFNEALAKMVEWKNIINDPNAKENEIKDASMKLGIVTSTMGSVFGYVGMDKVKEASNLLANATGYQDKQNAINNFKSDKDYTNSLFEEFMTGAAKQEFAYINKNLQTELKDTTKKNLPKLKHGLVTTFNHVLGIETDYSGVELPKDVIDAGKKFIKDLNCKLIVGTDGNAIFRSDDVVYVPTTLLESKEFSELLKGIALDKVITQVDKELKAKAGALYKIIIDTYVKATGAETKTEEDRYNVKTQAITALLFDKNFYYKVMLKLAESSCNENNKFLGIRFLGQLNTLFETINAEDFDNNNLDTKSYKKLLEIIRNNMQQALMTYAMKYQNISSILSDISESVLPKEYKDTILANKDIIASNDIDSLTDKNNNSEQLKANTNNRLDRIIDLYFGEYLKAGDDLVKTLKKMAKGNKVQRLEVQGFIRYAFLVVKSNYTSGNLSEEDKNRYLGEKFAYIPSDPNESRVKTTVSTVEESLGCSIDKFLNGGFSIDQVCTKETVDEFKSLGYNFSIVTDRFNYLDHLIYNNSDGEFMLATDGSLLRTIESDEFFKDVDILKLLKEKGQIKASEILAMKLPIEDTNIVLSQGEKQGHFNSGTNTIVLPDNGNEQFVKNTLMHELSHALDNSISGSKKSMFRLKGASANINDILSDSEKSKLVKYIQKTFPHLLEFLNGTNIKKPCDLIYYLLNAGEIKADNYNTIDLRELGFTFTKNGDLKTPTDEIFITKDNVKKQFNIKTDKQAPKKQETKIKQIPKKQETIVKQAPKKQVPKKQETNVKQVPKKQVPKKQETNVKQVPKKQVPKKQVPKKQVPKKQVPKKQETNVKRIDNVLDHNYTIDEFIGKNNIIDRINKLDLDPLKNYGHSKLKFERMVSEKDLIELNKSITSNSFLLDNKLPVLWRATPITNDLPVPTKLTIGANLFGSSTPMAEYAGEFGKLYAIVLNTTKDKILMVNTQGNEFRRLKPNQLDENKSFETNLSELSASWKELAPAFQRTMTKLGKPDVIKNWKKYKTTLSNIIETLLDKLDISPVWFMNIEKVIDLNDNTVKSLFGNFAEAIRGSQSEVAKTIESAREYLKSKINISNMDKDGVIAIMGLMIQTNLNDVKHNREITHSREAALSYLRSVPNFDYIELGRQLFTPNILFNIVRSNLTDDWSDSIISNFKKASRVANRIFGEKYSTAKHTLSFLQGSLAAMSYLYPKEKGATPEDLSTDEIGVIGRVLGYDTIVVTNVKDTETSSFYSTKPFRKRNTALQFNSIDYLLINPDAVKPIAYIENFDGSSIVASDFAIKDAELMSGIYNDNMYGLSGIINTIFRDKQSKLRDLLKYDYSDLELETEYLKNISHKVSIARDLKKEYASIIKSYTSTLHYMLYINASGTLTESEQKVKNNRAITFTNIYSAFIEKFKRDMYKVLSELYPDFSQRDIKDIVDTEISKNSKKQLYLINRTGIDLYSNKPIFGIIDNLIYNYDLPRSDAQFELPYDSDILYNKSLDDLLKIIDIYFKEKGDTRKVKDILEQDYGWNYDNAIMVQDNNDKFNIESPIVNKDANVDDINILENELDLSSFTKEHYMPKEIADLNKKAKKEGIDLPVLRNLTTTEAFRLMGLRDSEIARIDKSGISNTSKYHLAGDSIIADVFEPILENLLPQIGDKNVRMIELFSGYGSQALAMEHLSKRKKIKFESWKTCEWNVDSFKAYKFLHNYNDNKDYSLGMSKATLVNELFNMHISTDNKNPVKRSWLDHKTLEQLKNIYNYIKSTNNLVDVNRVAENPKLLDIKDTENNYYMMTYSFPCQALSSAGKREGMEEGSGTTSSMLWAVRDIIVGLAKDNKLPNCLIMENVTQIHDNTNIDNFNKWLNILSELGYTNNYFDLKGIDFNVPQNRPRTFCVSTLDPNFKRPDPIKLVRKLQDMLESPKSIAEEDSKRLRSNANSKGLFVRNVNRYIALLSNLKRSGKPTFGTTLSNKDISPTLTTSAKDVSLIANNDSTNIRTKLTKTINRDAYIQNALDFLEREGILANYFISEDSDNIIENELDISDFVKDNNKSKLKVDPLTVKLTKTPVKIENGKTKTDWRPIYVKGANSYNKSISNEEKYGWLMHKYRHEVTGINMDPRLVEFIRYIESLKGKEALNDFKNSPKFWQMLTSGKASIQRLEAYVQETKNVNDHILQAIALFIYRNRSAATVSSEQMNGILENTQDIGIARILEKAANVRRQNYDKVSLPNEVTTLLFSGSNEDKGKALILLKDFVDKYNISVSDVSTVTGIRFNKKDDVQKINTAFDAALNIANNVIVENEYGKKELVEGTQINPDYLRGYFMKKYDGTINSMYELYLLGKFYEGKMMKDKVDLDLVNAKSADDREFKSESVKKPIRLKDIILEEKRSRISRDLAEEYLLNASTKSEIKWILAKTKMQDGTIKENSYSTSDYINNVKQRAYKAVLKQRAITDPSKLRYSEQLSIEEAANRLTKEKLYGIDEENDPELNRMNLEDPATIDYINRRRQEGLLPNLFAKIWANPETREQLIDNIVREISGQKPINNSAKSGKKEKDPVQRRQELIGDIREVLNRIKILPRSKKEYDQLPDNIKHFIEWKNSKAVINETTWKEFLNENKAPTHIRRAGIHENAEIDRSYLTKLEEQLNVLKEYWSNYKKDIKQKNKTYKDLISQAEEDAKKIKGLQEEVSRLKQQKKEAFKEGKAEGKTAAEAIKRKITFNISDDFKVEMDRQPNELIAQLLATGWNKSDTTKVQVIGDNDEYMIANGKKFYEDNAFLLGEDKIDIEYAINWFLNTNVDLTSNQDDYHRFEAIRFYFLGYVYENAENLDLRKDLTERVRTALQNKASAGGTLLSIWKKVSNRIDAVKTMKEKEIVLGDIAITAAEQTKLYQAADRMDVQGMKDSFDEIFDRVKKEELAKGKKHGLLDRIFSFRAMAMLSSPITWLRNIVSNVALKRLNKWSEKIGNKLFKGHLDDQLTFDQRELKQSTNDFINANFIDNGFFDTIIGNISKYNPHEIPKHLDKDPDKKRQAILYNLAIKALYGEYYNNNAFRSDRLNKTHKFILNMLSDNNYVRESVIRYFGQLLENKGYDLTQGVTDSMMNDFGTAVGIGLKDYMHSDNLLNNVEQWLKGHNKPFYYAFKMILPFGATAFQWFKAAMRYSPAGLLKTILYDMPRMEKTIANMKLKIEKAKKSGEVLSSDINPALVEFMTKRNLGSGVIGTILFALGIMLTLSGFIDIDDDDYGKPTLHIGDLKVDVSAIFGSSSLLAGGALVVSMYKDGLTLDSVMKGLNASFDYTLADFFMTDIVQMDMYSDGGFANVLDITEDFVMSMVPNFISYVAGATYTGNLDKKGILPTVMTGNQIGSRADKFLATAISKVPILNGLMLNSKINPYTGDAGDPILTRGNRLIPYISYIPKDYRQSKSEEYGLSKTQMGGNFIVNKEKFRVTGDDLATMNRKYGLLNKNDLAKFYKNEMKVRIQVDNHYQTLSYLEMNQEQVKTALNTIMTNNAELCKIYAWTVSGHKYYATDTIYAKLKNAGITTNVYKGNSGFVK